MAAPYDPDDMSYSYSYLGEDGLVHNVYSDGDGYTNEQLSESFSEGSRLPTQYTPQYGPPKEEDRINFGDAVPW